MLNPSSSSKIMFSSGEDSPEKNSGRYSNHEDSEDQDDLNSLLYYSSDSLREYIQKGYDAENSSSGFSDEDGENTTILSITNSDTNDSMDNGKGDYEYDEDIGRSGCDGSDECDDKISSSLMNDDSVDSVGKSSSSSSRLILSGSDKFEARSKSNRRRETGRKQSKRTSSGSSHFFGEIKKSSAVKFQQSAMANPLMKRFLHDNCTFQLGDCDCKPSLGSTQGDDGIQDEFATPAGAAAKRRFDGNDDRKVGHAATTDHGNMSHPAKRTKNRNKQYIQMQQELCREKQHNAGSDSRQDSARNSAFSVASAWSSSITTTVTSAASSSAASLSDTKHTKSTQKNQSLELKYSESGYGSSFCDKRCDLKIAFSAAPFSTSPGTIRKAGATNDTVKSGRRKRGKASMGNKTSQGARTKQQPGSSMCSGTSHNDKDDPGYPYFNYVDHSLEDDDEPLVFLVPPSRVATFPVKMHVILSRKDLSHVISWMPHGRSWRLVDPVEFELTVIPTYFGHASLSSFMRQANGWGFKRVTKGRDMNSYYHEHFLRGLPHLCKKIPQPGSIKSKPEKTDVFREPDFAEISKNRPLPVEIDPKDVYAASLETIGKCILKDGPKARMPIICIDAGTASKRNEIASSLPVSSSIVKTDHSNEVHDSSASQQPSKVNNEATLTSPSGSNALMTSNAVSSVAAPQSTLINGFEAIKPLLQLQQHQPPQPQPVYRQLDNQQPPPVQLSNMTNNQTILQLQIMLMLHFNPSMLAGSTVLNSSGFQALNNQNTSAQNNTLHGNNSGQQSSHEAIDPNVLTLARQIVQMNATGGQTLHHQRSMESNSLADFYASTGNLAMSQAPQNNNTLSNQNLSGNPPNYEALATQIFGTLVHQYGQKQVQQHQHQHHQHHQQPQPQPQQQMQQQQQQQLSQFNQLLMRAATAGAMIQSDPLLTSGSRNHSTNNASQSSNDDATRRHNSKNDPDG